jgi:hypothetical protein
MFEAQNTYFTDTSVLNIRMIILSLPNRDHSVNDKYNLFIRFNHCFYGKHEGKESMISKTLWESLEEKHKMILSNNDNTQHRVKNLIVAL